ncbi:MAG: FAD-binding protein, partial [Magnetovibrio sp.]|nr:FAD-binding protein [Magnetovibrio sp.]
MPAQVNTDVLVVGAGAAGMYAAIAASRGGADVVLVDKSLIGRGGATIMAQMTVAAAVAEQEPDHWTHHLHDTLESGRGLCNGELAAVLCEEAPIRIRELGEWKIGWAREDDHMKQVMAPGHGVQRCVYVDFLNTGPAVAKTLRTQVGRAENVRRAGELTITRVIVRDGRAVGAVGLNMETGDAVSIAAKAVILAAGGLTRLYRRNSASVNMGGDSYALALQAGAELIDMEFVQFFPIGHLAPRLVGMDPIMWDPFRYKLGGRLLNGEGEEFVQNYGHAETTDKYTAPRDVASFAILQEVAAGRGSPAGGAYLSFEHIPEAELRAAFGPVIDRLAANGIDLTRRAIEVAPIAHYHMGGVRVDARMATRVPGLYAAGEAVGGANGANRLSGNALSEAFVFGERAGRFAAADLTKRDHAWSDTVAADAINEIAAARDGAPARSGPGLAGMLVELQEFMWRDVGLLRDQAGLDQALAAIRRMRDAIGERPGASDGRYALALQDWFDMRNALLVAETIVLGAQIRTESRGAQQRSDYPRTDPALAHKMVTRLAGTDLRVE